MFLRTTMKYHEAANLFPLLEDQEFKALCDDIAANGLIEPIVTYEGMILDGRNRYRACLELDVDPATTEYDGDDPYQYVISKNLHRRHLNETQRAVVASKLANMPAHRPENKSANLRTFVSQPEAAKMLNVSERSIQAVKSVERDAPDLVPLMEAGRMSAHEAVKRVQEIKRQELRHEIAEQGRATEQSDRWHIYQADISEWTAPRQYDYIITDPPYPREYLHLYGVLAKRAREWLKPGGLVIAMCGQSYFDQVIDLMREHLTYYWTACYLTPGQPTPLRHRQVNTSWKPLLIFSTEDAYDGKIFGDVFKSDANDKDFHKWGQSESGMYSIVSQICLPGQSILDPFCGAGTTGIAALKHGCLFDGLDILEENANIAKGRLAEWVS